MRTRKKELVSDEIKPHVGKIIKEEREKHNYSLEDLAKALNYTKNRQTLHKYETGLLNVPYDIFFDICRIFNISSDIINKIPASEEEKKILEQKLLKEYKSSNKNYKNLTVSIEKLLNTYKNVNFEPINNLSEVSIKMLDDSMTPYYEKNDKIYFSKQDDYKNGDDIVIAIKNNVLTVRRLYRYQKGIILQAMNPKYPTININVVANNMILGKVTAIYREK